MACGIAIGTWWLSSSDSQLPQTVALESHDSGPNSSDAAHSSAALPIVTHDAPDDVKSSFQQYLDQAPNRSIALFVLSWLYGDPAHFRALKERVQLEPEAGVLLAVLLKRQNAKAADYVKFLREGAQAFPDDRALALCLAGAEAEIGWSTRSESRRADAAGGYTAAIAALRRAAETGAGDLGATERQQSIRAWLTMIGTPDDLVWKKAAHADAEPQWVLSGLLQSSAAAIRSMKETTTLEDRVQLANDVFKLRALLNPSEDIFEESNRSLRDLETTALRMLPPETVVSENGVSVRQRLLEILNDFATRDYFIDFHLKPFLESATPATHMEFQQRREQDGIASALEWVRQQIPEAENTPPLEVQGIMGLLKTDNHLEGIPKEKRTDFRRQLEAYFVNQKGDFIREIEQEFQRDAILSESTLEAISATIAEFKRSYR
jgi:hypothetical protein